MRSNVKNILMLALWVGLSGVLFAGGSFAQSEDLQEADRLNDQVVELFQQGKYKEAIPFAQRELDIRENALGPEHPDVDQSLNNLALLYDYLGNYAAAEPLYQRSLAMREKALGSENTAVAGSLNKLAALYRAMGNYAAAEPLYQRSLAIMEKVLGPEHLTVATSLNNLAALYYAMSNYGAAEPLYQRSLVIREKALGAEHPDVAASLNNLAVLYRAMGNYAAAEPLYQRSLAIMEKTLGSEHPLVAGSLKNLALLYYNTGNYAAAEPLFKRSLAIYEKALGPEHPTVAGSLNNLAMLYQAIGNYAAAELLFKRSLAIKEKALGPEHPYVAESLNNLALLYRETGNYAAAEPLFKRSLTIFEKALGPEHPHVAGSLNNLAALYYNTGNYAAAESLFKRSLAINEKALGPESPEVASNHNNLAQLYNDMGNYAAAELLYKRSLAITVEALGPEHPYVAKSLNGLAVLYVYTGDYAAAELLLKRSLAIYEKALGPEHPDVAESLNNLAGLYHDMGNYAAAEPLYKRSLAIYEKALDPEHPDVATSLVNSAMLNVNQGKNQHALSSMMRAQGIDERMIEQVSGFTSPVQTMHYLTTIQSGLHILLSLVSIQIKKDDTARRQVFEVWLRRKGVVLEAQRRMQEALLEAGDTEANKVFDELSQTRSRLAQMTFAGPGKEDASVYRKNLKELNDRREELDAKLSRLSQPYAKARKARKVTASELAQVLPQGTALLDFARIDVFDFEAKGKEQNWLPAHYLAFVLKPGKGQDVALLDLGPAEEIDTALDQLKSALKLRQQANARNLCRRLHDAVFAPVEKELGGAKRVFISPDGALNLIPFELFRDPDGKYLIETYTFNYLAAGRDLVGFGEKKASAEKPLLIGDPDFDLDAKQRAGVLANAGLSGDTAVAATRSAELGGMHFKRLPGTRKEVGAIGDLIGKDRCEVLLGRSALEEVLMLHKAPAILHLATHGFFLKDQEVAAMPGFRGIGVMEMEQPFVRLPRPGVSVENPLLRCGLALAGANRAGSAEKGGDGILTADEVLSLSLRGTELVVLSACETGLGEVKKGEGVYGLRRAFAQAGARSLVMSMWSVPDRETRELMEAFYRNALSGKLDRCQALRQAALMQREVVRLRYGQDIPYYWGAFVFLGQAD